MPEEHEEKHIHTGVYIELCSCKREVRDYLFEIQNLRAIHHLSSWAAQHSAQVFQTQMPETKARDRYQQFQKREPSS